MCVTGVDYSRRSIEYATLVVQQNDLDIEYRYQDYLTLQDKNCYNTALLVYGDYCPLSPSQRSQLLGNVRRALKPGGQFILDLTTRLHRQQHGSHNGWYAEMTGFWKPGPHLVLEEGGFTVLSVWNDLIGTAYPEDTGWIGEVTRKNNVLAINGTLSDCHNRACMWAGTPTTAKGPLC